METLRLKAYVLQLAKTIVADGLVNVKELRRLYEVMSAFKIGFDSRAEILDLVYFHPQKLQSMLLESELLEEDEVRIALAKDVLFIRAQEDNDFTAKVAKDIVNQLGVTEAQYDFLSEWVAWENSALRRLGAGELDLADEGDIKELGARAAAVGIPVAALYFAGAVGFSAVGITSGLATLGGASGLILLGLNPMTAGVAALIIAGVSVKKFCDYALGVSKKRQLEAALQQAKELQQRYREYLLQDLTELEKGSISDWFAGKVNKRKKAVQTLRFLLTESIRETEGE